VKELPSSGESQDEPRQREGTDSEDARRGRGQEHELRLTIQNDLAELTRVNESANEILQRSGADEQLVYATQLALEEVLSNVIRHGYPDSNRHEIALTLRAGAGRIELEIADDGREFDPTTAPEAELDLPLAERRAGGLGIHLVRAFVREIHYERRRGRNLLRLRI